MYAFCCGQNSKLSIGESVLRHVETWSKTTCDQWGINVINAENRWMNAFDGIYLLIALKNLIELNRDNFDNHEANNVIAADATYTHSSHSP